MAGLKIGKTEIGLALRLVLGAVFIFSGGLKVLDPAAFQADVANFRLLPWGLSGAVALFLPWLEVICGVALVAKIRFAGAIAMLAGMMVVFTVILAITWARGLDVSCGCFGSSGAAANYPLLIGRNILILAGIAAIFRIGDNTCMNKIVQPTAEPPKPAALDV